MPAYMLTMYKMQLANKVLYHHKPLVSERLSAATLQNLLATQTLVLFFPLTSRFFSSVPCDTHSFLFISL